MRRPKWSKRLFLLAALPVFFILGFAAIVFVRTQHTLNRSATAVARAGQLPFEVRTLGRIENPGFEPIAAPATYSSGAFYHGKLYVSGPSGLFVYGAGLGTGASLQKSYRVGIDLPAAPLGQVVAGRLRGATEPELIIATAGQGVLIFSANGSADGSGTFRQLLPENAEACDVTALLPLGTGELLIGTRRHGLLIYHGITSHGLTSTNSLEAFHPELATLSVTALAADASGFWVGTRDHGVWHWHAGQIDSFEAVSTDASRGSGVLPDAQVDAIAVHGDRVFVGTPLGVEEFVDGRPARTLAKNLFANALYADDKSLTVGSIDEGIQQVSLESSPRQATSRSLIASDDSAAATLQFLATSNADSTSLYAVTRDGPRLRRSDGSWTALIRESAASTALSDANISALAFDPDGRLWIGYFDKGLDILSINANNVERAKHYEDDRLFCINRIVVDPRRNTMDVATANGLVLFDAQSRPRQVMTRRDGLIADHVTDIAFSGESMVLATPAGITFVDGDGARSMYGFQGLVNNHVYALASRSDGEVLAGTLGGVSELAHESIVRNLTVANSGLKHNWVTAIVPVVIGATDNSATFWMIGTYGAGVMRLDGDGRFTPMEGVTQPMEINPNAMLATGSNIIAGTLGKGLWVWSRSTGRWRQITAGLPSENVTALAEHAGEIYVGTDNGLVRIAERLLD